MIIANLCNIFTYLFIIFLGAWEQYSENYCFVQNTYFLPLNHYIPQDVEQREEREIGWLFLRLFF